MKTHLGFSLILVGFLILIVFLFPSHNIAKLKSQTASTFFIDSVDVASLREKYETDEPINILVVPGHDPSSFGTIDGAVRELDLTLELGQYLAAELKKDEHFKVTLAQTTEGFLPELETYFKEEEDNIWNFRDMKAKIMNTLIGNGKITQESIVDHISASNDTALKLYGLNRWANENDIDLVLHIHFNDYPGRRSDAPPKYTGFALYLPERQYSNSKVSWEIGRQIADNLAKTFTVSNHPKEKSILVPDQELIAIGAFNTLDAASVLIEYGYIYESHLAPATPRARSQNLKQLSRLTTEGIEDFFKDKPAEN